MVWGVRALDGSEMFKPERTTESIVAETIRESLAFRHQKRSVYIRRKLVLALLRWFDWQKREIGRFFALVHGIIQNAVTRKSVNLARIARAGTPHPGKPSAA